MSTQERRILILGAAGRDFHDFNVYWKQRKDCRVVAFTAAQIPNIAGRLYPAELAGGRYPGGIPILPEEDLEAIIRREQVDEAALAYSDLSHEDVMHKAARVNAAGADFVMLGWRRTMLRSRKPVIAVCAVRTGCGKSQTTRRIAGYLREAGRRVAVVRHPMPYGDLARQVCQRFAEPADLDRHDCTIEEREEYEPHLRAGNIVFAGVDYERILRAAEEEADVILWDGGNNDISFFRADLYLTVADPLRAGHELRYYPGEINARLADLVIINKVDSAAPEAVAAVRADVLRVNPRARVIEAESPVVVEDPEAVRGRDVLAVEDGPTVTHGGMTFGAALVAARRFGARRTVDPRPHAVGSIRETFERYPHLTDVLPAMGYGDLQVRELEATINATPCDAVLVGTPIDLRRILRLNKPTVRVRYELAEREPAVLREAVLHAAPEPPSVPKSRERAVAAAR
ncbi:MAG: cyclic 2,3-diphosphoglycerate synthase [Phycisphaerae bacterium]|nr:GTPase [Planctomycetia bacterium]MCK6463839.1 cyclic 2,3-diphosphoglycerate synthase [Phycisphaerae bacterium]MCL4717446.1 cyclic 2,3-diphosphoglycerate synthase [Phycisphaerae bacterium]NUQ07589.1 GTPase [Phycisphaerae bacterium]